MSLTFRTLTSADLDQILEINSQHARLMGRQKADDYNEVFAQYVTSYLTRDNKYLLGAFQEKQLLSYLGVVPWKGSRFWTFTNLKSRAQSLLFNPASLGLPQLADLAITTEKANGRVGFWILSNKRHYRIMAGEWRKSVQPLENFYFVSRTIPPNHRPQSPIIWSIMGEKTHTESLVLRVGIRKENTEDMRPFQEVLQLDISTIETADNEAELTV